METEHDGLSDRSTPMIRTDPLPKREEALDLINAAISAGIFNDLGSGSNVDACVITATKTDMLRNFVKPNERVTKERTYGFRRGTTAFTKEEIRNLVVCEEIIGVRDDAMDVDGS
jgi:20S proteasome subunit beta 2